MASRGREGGRKRGGAAKPKEGNLVGAAVKKASAPPVKRNNDLPEVTIRVQRKSTHHRTDFDRKMAALKRLSDQGKLFKQANPVARDTSITGGFKDRIIRKIHNKYVKNNKGSDAQKAKDREAAERMKQRVRDQNPDHVWELQLGGPDEVSNLKLMDADTNQDIGTQIRVQIMNLPDGTPIRIEVVD
ncbi:endonuclease [Micromonospora sp. NPDC005189]|uniref:endonuclease n=1 Tax=Micromonospora sp. NPDC005189 TaxID=3157019 RepID=UPI0033B12F9B